jgi:hypothetical protein
LSIKLFGAKPKIEEEPEEVKPDKPSWDLEEVPIIDKVEP